MRILSMDDMEFMLTGKGQQAKVGKDFEDGADDYFAIPFNPSELIKKLEQVLG